MGKTTVSAALARAAALAGLSDPDRRGRGQERPGHPVRPAAVRLRGGRALARRRPRRRGRRRGPHPDPRRRPASSTSQDHGMSRISRRLASTGAVDMVATAAPGIKDILILGKVKQLEQRQGGRPDRARRPGRRPRHQLPALGPGPARRGAGRADQHPGPRRARAADRPGPLPGDAGHPARGDAGQRAGRDGLQPRGRGRRQPRAGRGQRAATRTRRASTPTRWPRPRPPARRCDPGEAEALAGAADFRRHRMALQAEQVARLAETLPLPQLALPYLFDADLGPAQVDAAGRRRCSTASSELDDLAAGADREPTDAGARRPPRDSTSWCASRRSSCAPARAAWARPPPPR